MPYCGKCGSQTEEGAVFCGKCGAPVNQNAPQPEPYTAPSAGNLAANRQLLIKLSERIKISAIIWIVIGIAQALTILGCAVPVALLGVYNIYVGIRNLKYGQTILTNPVCIVAGQESLAMPILSLVVNLLLGGMIGCVGALYDIICIRGLVMDNKDAFLQMEREASM